MQPLYNSQPKWLIPIIGLVILLVALTIYLAGRRDLGASTFVDKDSAKPHTKLLSGPLLATIRLTRSASVAWLAGVATMAFFFGLLAKSASQALSQSSGLNREFGRVLHVSQSIGATAFLGFIFFLLMIVIMSYTASAVSAMREDEAEGLLDNLLVRRVSRLQWLRDRLSIVIIVIVIASLLSTIGSWIGANSQHAGVAYHTLFLAGVNTISPAVFILGIAVFAMGVIPRLTSVLSYGVIVLSFLISLIGSGIKLNHWILDTSILQHVSLAPAVKPNWSSGIMLICIGLIMALIGSLVFNRRDLAAE
jgi:ABC-2 type transport system permease protein